MKLNDLKIKIFADGANMDDMLRLYELDHIQGFTTNPTLMNSAGITDYTGFAQKILESIPDRPISFEVFSDEIDEMERQARIISEWADNVYVKIPVTNTKQESTASLIKRLTNNGVKLNITAIFTLDQVRVVANALNGGAPSFISVFAGRIADSGVDPLPIMQESLSIIHNNPKAELLWASPREIYNVVQADQIGCHIITATAGILNKLTLLGKDLEEFSLDTVKMFYNDAQAAGFEL